MEIERKSEQGSGRKNYELSHACFAHLLKQCRLLCALCIVHCAYYKLNCMKHYQIHTISVEFSLITFLCETIPMQMIQRLPPICRCKPRHTAYVHTFFAYLNLSPFCSLFLSYSYFFLFFFDFSLLSILLFLLLC